MKFELEICANSVASCIEAEKGGATRVELCMGIPEGGTTPSAGMIREALDAIKIPVHVIIRPRSGDFHYSAEELREMAYDIRLAKEMGAHGVVFGCLTPEGEYDVSANRMLLKEAEGMQITFHRAFDVCRNPHLLLQTLIAEGGFTRILTSGCAPTAPEGADLIHQLVEEAQDRIGIMAGCGVRPANLEALAKTSGAHMFHSSLRKNVESEMVFRRKEVSMGGTVQIEEYANQQTSADLVRTAVRTLENL